MGPHAVPARLEQLLGAAVMVVVVLDVFLYVLYARLGSGIFSYHVARATWRVFHWFAKLFRRQREQVLTYCGPAILVVLVMTWALGLTVGTALIIHPGLGTGITATSGPTPREFLTAMYAAGGSIAIVGATQYVPRTDEYQALYLVNSLIGLSIVSLTLMYLMQVYTALHGRNTLGLQVHLASGETGDAAELLARLGPRGRFESGYTDLSQLAQQVSAAQEGHHFYPVLFYFRFREPFYAVSRFSLVSLDLATLIESALDDGRYGWLKESAAVAQIGRAADLLVIQLADTFLGGSPRDEGLPEPAVAERWRRRFHNAIRRLRRAGIATVSDEAAGADAYVAARARWDRHITALPPAMGYTIEQIDPAGQRPSTDCQGDPGLGRSESDEPARTGAPTGAPTSRPDRRGAFSDRRA